MLDEEELIHRLHNTDRGMLDEELIDQSQLMWNANELLTQAIDERDLCKAELRELEARLTIKYRKRFERMDKKPTERMVDNEVHADEDYLSLERKLIKKQKRVNSMAGLKESYFARTHILRSLAQMFVSGYLTSDSVTGGKEVEEFKHESRRRRMSDKRRSRTK